MKRIFIGGTGRSGTSILLHALSFHPELYTIPIETKFLVQVDGLYSLVKNLTSDYAPNEAAVARDRFRSLMQDVITHSGPNPYAGYPDAPYGRMEFVPQELFQNYFEVLNDFFQDVQPRFWHRRLLIERCRTLIDSLFGEKALARGCSGWIEKTPNNFVHIDFLNELYPDSLFINCIRDPRGVLHSFRRLNWLSGSIEEDADFLACYYEHLAAKREIGLARPTQYCEVKLEELVADPTAILSRILEFLGAAPYDTDRLAYLQNLLRTGSLQWSPALKRFEDAWEREYSESTIAAISERLGDSIRQYGYSL